GAQSHRLIAARPPARRAVAFRRLDHAHPRRVAGTRWRLAAHRLSRPAEREEPDQDRDRREKTPETRRCFVSLCWPAVPVLHQATLRFIAIAGTSVEIAHHDAASRAAEPLLEIAAPRRPAMSAEIHRGAPDDRTLRPAPGRDRA